MSEATVTDPPAGDRVGDRIRAFVSAHPVVVAVVALTLVGLFARFAYLGWRVAHWDEARVAYWVDYTAETGKFAYNSHTHGPVVQHLARYAMGLFGASDFAVRLPVAVIGGLLPATALLYRHRLRDAETVILAAFLAANPVLLYYSRFMRSDLLVATFMFAAFGLLVRFYDERRMRYLYSAVICLALGIGSKENAPLYVLTWLGAGALLLDTALYRPRSYRRGTDLAVAKIGRLRAWIGKVRANAISYVSHGLGLTAVFLAVITFLFAARGGGVAGIYQPPDGLSLWAAITSPWRLPALVVDTLGYVFPPPPVGEYWGFGNMDAVVLDLPGSPEVDGTGATVPYLERLGGMTNGLVQKGAPLVAFAVVGFLRERYAAARSRPLVLLMFYAGIASILGYPLVFSIDSGWKWGMTHVLVPLAIPAAVGLGIVGRWGIDAYRQDDRIDVGLSAVVIGIVAFLVVGTAVAGAYAPNNRSGENPLVQYGQPADDLRPVLERMQAVAETHDGTDVLIYDNSTDGDVTYVRDDPESSSVKDFRPICTEWGNTLPMNWYIAAYDAETDCAKDPDTLRNRTSGDDPVPIVMTRAADATVPADRLNQDYRALTYELRTDGSEATFYVHEDWWTPG
ncbi:MAG: flippase activity-associated protein Agl23 [Halorhabdus sp.]